LGGGPFLSPANRKEQQMSDSDMTAKQKSGESWGELAKTVIYAGLIAIVIRTFLFQPFNIPSASMEATLLVGDYLFVQKFSYGYSRYTFPFGAWPVGDRMQGRFMGREPTRGDVIVFKYPQDNSTDFIKRLIGMPGETIQMKSGRLYINGKIVPRKRVDDYVETYRRPAQPRAAI
jgi:signal peptidase I